MCDLEGVIFGLEIPTPPSRERETCCKFIGLREDKKVELCYTVGFQVLHRLFPYKV